MDRLFRVVSVVSVTASVVMLCAMLFFVYPEQKRDDRREAISISNQVSNIAENDKIDILNKYLSSHDVIAKRYVIEKGSQPPAPKQENFVTVAIADIDSMNAVIDRAQGYGLLKREDLEFRTDLNFYGNSVEYYLDESIFAVTWQEDMGESVLTFAEYKVADASQFRRKLAGDAYGSGRLMYCTEMAKQTNAVAAMNADFYSFRNLGITCYDGRIYRAEGSLDTLFVDNNGDFILYPRGQGKSAEELQCFVDENKISFGISFGPIAIQDGEWKEDYGYPVGETRARFSRAAICQLGKLHYLYAHLGHYSGKNTTTVNVFSRYLYDKGIKNAYILDGGQTGELVFNGKIKNRVDYGSERTVSDIIYFATAVRD